MHMAAPGTVSGVADGPSRGANLAKLKILTYPCAVTKMFAG
jgi:hypothetical protein